MHHHPYYLLSVKKRQAGITKNQNKWGKSHSCSEWQEMHAQGLSSVMVLLCGAEGGGFFPHEIFAT